MNPITALFFLITCITIPSCISVKKFGLYSGSGYTSGCSFILKPDSTFEYGFRGHMVRDTSAGNYYLKDDTLYLNYTYDPYGLEVLAPPITARPRFAIWRKNKLYPIYSKDERLNKKHVLRYSN